MSALPNWLAWARELHSIAQAGRTYARDPYDLARYEAVQHVAAELLAAHSNAAAEDLLELLKLEAGYATPKVDVRAVVFRGDKLLLTRERDNGLWSLPGGWADPGEGPGEMAARETREETGYEVRPVKLLAVYDKAKHNHPPEIWDAYKLFVRCELLGGEARGSIETSEAAFFGEHELPRLSLNRVLPSQIARMFDHLRDPLLPTDFD